jgi:hypothetical protein
MTTRTIRFGLVAVLLAVGLVLVAVEPVFACVEPFSWEWWICLYQDPAPYSWCDPC